MKNNIFMAQHFYNGISFLHIFQELLVAMFFMPLSLSRQKGSQKRLAVF